MGRIRTLKPEFFRSRSLARVSIPARMTFQGLWCEADDFGRGVADPRIVKGSVWPLEDSVGHDDVAEHLHELATTGHVRLYEVKGETFYEIRSWEQHQAAAYRRGKSMFPAPEEAQAALFAVPAAPQDVQESAGTRNEERGTPTGGAADAATGVQELVKGYCDDYAAERSGKMPPRSFRGAAGRAVKTALGDRESPDDIARCLGVIAHEGKNPSSLPYVLGDFHANRERRMR